MRWILLIMCTTICFAAPAYVNDTVPLLDCEQEDYMDGMEELLAQTTVSKTPRWQLMLQQWGTTLVAYFLQLKEYTTEQLNKLKLRLYALWYKKNRITVEQ